QMVYRSNHPKSRALAVVVSPQSLSGEVEEQVGVGLTMTDPTQPGRQLALVAATDGRDLRFVERRLSPDASSDISKSEYLEVREIARFAFREIIRADARAQVETLQRLGVEVHLASGDAEDRAMAIGRELGLAPTSVHARMKPEDKAALVARLESTLGPTLMLGDGVNDALAFDAATVAGTPAIDRPTLPARADFFLTTRGVGPIAELLVEAQSVRRITTRNLVIAFGYNGLALTAALMGVLSPLVSAVAMPISSLLVLALTIGSQRQPRACPAPLAPTSAGPTPNLEATA
ncbi:MAG TPA: HAD-IC family P-type ATPase, partial [Myxococcota bacterium]|nr:HAD-IC family P-type ATPase [Myxococcota bacterium]